MKPAHRLRIDTDALCAYLAEMALWLIEALACIGCDPELRRFLVDVATKLKHSFFMRAVAAANLRAHHANLRLAPLHHAHSYIRTRDIIRAMLGKDLRGLTHGDDLTRIRNIQRALENAEAIIARITRRILRKTDRFCVRRLTYNPPRTLTLASAGAPHACVCADTS